MSTVQSWLEHERYSIMHDATMIRMSGFDAQGQEHWMRIPALDGVGLRAARAHAQELIETHIMLGLEPGEVLDGP